METPADDLSSGTNADRPTEDLLGHSPNGDRPRTGDRPSAGDRHSAGDRPSPAVRAVAGDKPDGGDKQSGRRESPAFATGRYEFHVRQPPTDPVALFTSSRPTKRRRRSDWLVL